MARHEGLDPILTACGKAGLNLGSAALILLMAASQTAMAATTNPKPTNPRPADPRPSDARAVVIVSGGGSVTPFTTPTQACKRGLAAGNSATALRQFLLSKGKRVFTAPAMVPWGTVAEPDPSSFGAFGDCPIVLPEQFTIMTLGDIDASGEKLARFLTYLHTTYKVREVDLVGHSNGGLYSRAATRIIQQTKSPVRVRSITMLGTPNHGSVPGSFTWGELSLADCRGNSFCQSFNQGWAAFAARSDLVLNRENTFRYLDGQGLVGSSGWNAAQAGYLDGIPVTLLAGTYFTNSGGAPRMWPYDGITSRYSAWAEGLSDAVMPHRTCWQAPLTHSIFVSDKIPADWQTAITWNTAALKRVNQAIDQAGTALQQPTRQGCQG